jgi:TPR repeat protein
MGIEADLIADDIIQKPFETCLRLAKNSSAKGSPFGDYALACIYLYRNESLNALHISDRLNESQANSLITNAVPKLEELANNGNQYAKMVLGYIYSSGQGGVTPDTKKGIAFLKDAANNNFPHADYVLGNIYRDGKGVIADEEFAQEFFQRALINGDPIIMRNSGFNLVKDSKKESIKAGFATLDKYFYNYQDPKTADNVAEWIFNREPFIDLMGSDKGWQVNHDKGLFYMEISAEHGSAKNQVRLAEAYYQGADFLATKFEKNHNKVFKFAKLASESKSSRGALILGKLYQDGIGCNVDLEKAVEAFYNAVTNFSDGDDEEEVASVQSAKYLQRMGKDDLIQKALEERTNREKMAKQEQEKMRSFQEEQKRESMAAQVAEIEESIERYMKLVKDDKPSLDSGPDKENIIYAMWPLCGVMEKQFNDRQFEILRGSPLISQGYKNIPIGVDMYPIRLSGSQLQFTFYFYRDEFNNWKSIEK